MALIRVDLHDLKNIAYKIVALFRCHRKIKKSYTIIKKEMVKLEQEFKKGAFYMQSIKVQIRALVELVKIESPKKENPNVKK